MNKIIHLVRFSPAFIPQQISYLNKWFVGLDQTFFVYGAPKRFFDKTYENVHEFSSANIFEFIAAALEADRIIFNGLFDFGIPLLFARFPDIVKKGIWLPWGGDLYWHSCVRESTNKKIDMAFRRQFIRWLYAIATPIRGDYELARIWYETQARYIESAPNIFYFSASELEYSLDLRLANNVVTIQLGNSGDPSNEHIEMFEWCSRFNFKGRKVSFYVPLSYGDKGYIGKVIRRGKELLGDRFVPMTRFLPHEEYNRHLASLDVLILNHCRPQGFNTTAISLYLGVKVFLHSDITTWTYLNEQLGCRIFDTQKIPDLSFDALIKMPDSSREQNRKNIAVLFDRDWQRAMWRRLYEG